MPQCESCVFFPDDPAQPPQFSGCPRNAETTRRTWRIVIRKREPTLMHLVVHLCAKCAAVWDEQDVKAKFRMFPSTEAT